MIETIDSICGCAFLLAEGLVPASLSILGSMLDDEACGGVR